MRTRQLFMPIIFVWTDSDLLGGQKMIYVPFRFIGIEPDSSSTEQTNHSVKNFGYFYFSRTRGEQKPYLIYLAFEAWEHYPKKDKEIIIVRG